MKLYIWADPYSVAYGSSLLVVIASNLEEAKQQAAQGTAWTYGKYESDSFRAAEFAALLGEPTRVIETPCAEWHHWEE